MTLGDVLIVLAVLGAALFCPVMMWIQNRRGRAPACCWPANDDGRIQAADLEGLRRRQQEIGAQLAEAEGPGAANVAPRSQHAG